MHNVVVHAHCYQPPREDPWLEVVETERSAAPDHDWNARIDRECYARMAETEARHLLAGAMAGDPDARSGVARLINLYGWCTFDVGATLCEWMETGAPNTLRAMIEGDAASVRRWGHGNAIAAPYHHVILPLASPRDRRTEVRWGIADFQRRFGRFPEGMWLPECAADDDTLDLLAEEGIMFTILAPYQVTTAEETHGLPVLWTGASGRKLAILPYDGGLAGEVAFGGLLQNPSALAARLAPSISDGQNRCTTLATDGETFGHHHRNGERTLALALATISQRTDARITNAASVIAANPPTRAAKLVSPSSWSCAHGVERWRSNCGCRLNHDKPPAQEWRGPLRLALTKLADQSAAIFEREGTPLFHEDPWQARDDYGAVVGQDGDTLEQFAHDAVCDEKNVAHAQRARELLEMQRATLRLFTSCAWFFDDVDRIETRQVLRYAARVLELSGEAARLEPDFIQWLERAHASDNKAPTASDVFVRAGLPHMQASWSVAAGAIAMASAGNACTRVGAYDVKVTAPSESETQYRAELRHRRTGVSTVVKGSVDGEGPSLSVKVHDETGTTREVAMHELPEDIARTLLRPFALDSSALTG